MIEINLLPGKKAKAKAAGAGFKLALPDFRGLLASIKNPWLIAASASAVVVIGGGLLLFITLSTRLRVLESKLDAVRIEKQRFDAVIAQKRQSERIRDSLIAEINIIHGIDAERYIWPHILDQVTKALPPYTWLTSIGLAGGGSVAPGSPGSTPAAAGAGAASDSTGVPVVRVWITGNTVDIQAYTTFLRQLAASPWLTDVTPATSSTIIEHDRPVTAFNVQLRYRLADSVYIRTVPFTQPVR
jgi:Tfp pilus assembly protein PilN